MKELINAHQAHLLMLAVLVLAPLIGLAGGLWAKRLGRGLGVGLAVGVGNFLLWTLYNALTDKLGLDTVKNLLVNLCLFVGLGPAGRRRVGASGQVGGITERTMATWREIGIDNFRAGRELLDGGRYRSSVSRFYYAAFCVLTHELLAQGAGPDFRDGRETPGHAQLPRLVEMYFARLTAERRGNLVGYVVNLYRA